MNYEEKLGYEARTVGMFRRENPYSVDTPIEYSVGLKTVDVKKQIDWDNGWMKKHEELS